MNSELFKEGYDEAMYKNSCKIGLCDLISVPLDITGETLNKSQNQISSEFP